jgi:hypothetical protein
MNPRTRLPDVGEHTVDPQGSTAETETPVREVMLRHPKTVPVRASIEQVGAVLTNDHVHLVLLTDGSRLAGTLTRADLPPPGTLGSALAWSTLVGRTVSPDTPTTEVHRLLIDHGIRRVAVVDADGSLLGLMCLKQRRIGFCSDADVAARSQDRDEGSELGSTSGYEVPQVTGGRIDPRLAFDRDHRGNSERGVVPALRQGAGPAAKRQTEIREEIATGRSRNPMAFPAASRFLWWTPDLALCLVSNISRSSGLASANRCRPGAKSS